MPVENQIPDYKTGAKSDGLWKRRSKVRAASIKNQISNYKTGAKSEIS